MLLLLIIPVVSTLLGGLLAMRLRRFAVVLLGLSAGLLLGAAFLDLLPEALSLNGSSPTGAANILAVTLLSFFLFAALHLALDAMASRWQHSERTLGRVGGALLIFHSLRDGMAIGLSYAASHPAGYAVAAGIAAHDIGDGMNTVLLTTRGNRPSPADFLFLCVDALAPLAGGLLTVWWTFSARSSVVFLAVAAGFFIQMATGDLLPQGHSSDQSHQQKRSTLLAVICGAAFIYLANVLMGQLHRS